MRCAIEYDREFFRGEGQQCMNDAKVQCVDCNEWICYGCVEPVSCGHVVCPGCSLHHEKQHAGQFDGREIECLTFVVDKVVGRYDS